MNFTAPLAPIELAALISEKKSLNDVTLDFDRSSELNATRNESAFERSLRIKNTLDIFESSSQTEPEARLLAVLVNGEYQLWRLNRDTPLQHNPFLSHWVEAIQRLDKPDSVNTGARATKEAIDRREIDSVRALWIKTLLQEDKLDNWEKSTPLEIYGLLQRKGTQKPFDIQLYLRMLEDEGIYEKTPEPVGGASSSPVLSESNKHNNTIHTSSKAMKQSPEDAVQQQKEDILCKLREQPDAAVYEMTHLPIEIAYLDFLTTLLAQHTLEKHSIEPALVITQYIQHALRTIEKMEKPPSPVSQELDGGWTEVRAESNIAEYGKEAQSRSVRLLLLFIKSLIRKGLVELDVLYFEIAEITVRYVWIREVREFRAWAEDGIVEVGDGE